jgi:hypothetical protein
MSSDEDRLRRRFSEDSRRELLEGLSSDEIDVQIDTLQTLSGTIAFANEQVPGSFPIRDFSEKLVLCIT